MGMPICVIGAFERWWYRISYLPQEHDMILCYIIDINLDCGRWGDFGMPRDGGMRGLMPRGFWSVPSGGMGSKYSISESSEIEPYALHFTPVMICLV